MLLSWHQEQWQDIFKQSEITQKRYLRISTSKEAMKKLIQIPHEQLARHVWHLRYKLFTVECQMKHSLSLFNMQHKFSLQQCSHFQCKCLSYRSGTHKKSNVSHIYQKFPSSGTLIVLQNYIIITSLDRLHKKRKKKIIKSTLAKSG